MAPSQVETVARSRPSVNGSALVAGNRIVDWSFVVRAGWCSERGNRAPGAVLGSSDMPHAPRVYATPAIVLRQRKLGDADKILTLYTARFGKVDAVAKGVRKTKSRMAGHVEPLTQATFQLAKG